MVSNFDTKRIKIFYHPYNTRSRRSSSSYHDNSTHPPPPAPPSLKDTTNVPRSSNKQLKDTTNVPRSSNKVINDKPAAGGPANVIPLPLYRSIQKALSSRKDWDANKDKDSEEMLKLLEAVVWSFVRLYKSINVLPHDWTYDPATASTLVPSNKDDIFLGGCVEPTKGWEDDSDSDLFIPPSTKCPPIYDVCLKKDEIESWRQFIDLDECNCARVKESSKPKGVKIPVDIRHPIVNLTGYFVVFGFNKAYEMYIKKGECNRLRDPVFKEFAYRKVSGKLYKAGGCYHFYMLIEAVEDGIRGIYWAKVRCTFDGERTLLRFSLTDGTNAVESVKDAYLSMQFKKLKDEVDVPYDSGMKCRKTAMGCARYDFFNVYEYEELM